MRVATLVKRVGIEALGARLVRLRPSAPAIEIARQLRLLLDASRGRGGLVAGSQLARPVSAGRLELP